ncbi:MAG: M10 family metallopeptidase C-terminal domain-containing protein, partial [Paracoccaceae bacterium]
HLSSSDTIDGGAGTDELRFTDSGSATSDLDGVTNVETVTLGDAATSVTTVDALVGSEETLTLSAAALKGTNALIWDGSAETNGSFNITGSSQADTIKGGAGADTITGGAGADTFYFSTGNESTVLSLDTVTDFISGADKFVFSSKPNQVITSSHYSVDGTGHLQNDISQAVVSGGIETDVAVYVLEIKGIWEGNYLFFDENADNNVGIDEIVINLGENSDTVLSVSDFI